MKFKIIGYEKICKTMKSSDNAEVVGRVVQFSI
jgi:hypothetical protein